ncbi:MAG: aconitate hydratase [Pyrinomonadaceae bacterium]|nr:aconitate hydratase [Pyrinomonadaceae bacterium]
MAHDLFGTKQKFEAGGGREGTFYSLPQLEKDGIGNISRLPISIRIVLESVLRNYDEGKTIEEADVKALANWGANAERNEEVPFVIARVILQDFTGVPLLVDLAAMRSATARLGADPEILEPLVPVDLVIDHSVQVDYAGSEEAYERNMAKEFERNEQRYKFLKWGTQAFNGFKVVPPGIGIVHQVNLEYLARGVFEKEGVYYPDTLVGTDSHTTMINGLGIVGWGVGGIEAEAGMLGQPIYILTPDVVGFHMSGSLPEGATATDLVLRVVEMLREAKVVGKFVEFFGEGASNLHATDRATIANMAPEYGATMGFFGVDDKTLDYFRATGRSEEKVETIRNYFTAQGMFGIPQQGEVDYTKTLDLDLSTVTPSVSGPRRPQDRIELSNFKQKFSELFIQPVSQGGFGMEAAEFDREIGITLNGTHKGEISGGGEQSGRSIPLPVVDAQSAIHTSVTTESEMVSNRPTPDVIDSDDALEESNGVASIGHGDVIIAAITSCTNTSNPSVMLAAGITAKKAVERGMTVPKYVKTSLAPGSRVVTEYLEKTGLQEYLDAIGFDLVGYGCTTCIGNSGPLHPAIEKAVVDNDLVVSSVLSGNRNFEARIHQNIKANFLMSPPLVVAYALAGTVNKDFATEPVGKDRDGNDVFLKDIWASLEEVEAIMGAAFEPETYKALYGDFAEKNPLWNKIPTTTGKVYEWDESSTYIQEPPYFEGMTMEAGDFADIQNARPLALFGDSVTTDHISPAGAFSPNSPAGQYLQENGVEPKDFNSYGSRRGNDRVMLRGSFANVRIKNRLVSPKEGGFTLHQPSGEEMTIYDAAMKYKEEGTPLIILAGTEYGTGSSRDWAAKGTLLMGVKAVVAKSFERIHRSNLIGMGVLPLQFKGNDTVESLGLDGTETFDLVGVENTDVKPLQDVILRIKSSDGTEKETSVQLRIDTPIEVEYYRHGGILQYVLRQIINENR